MEQLAYLTLRQALDALENGDCTSRQLTRACLERIDQYQPWLHAFINVTPQLAMEQADLADRMRSDYRQNQANPLPELCGLPVAIKDVLCQAGIPCTCGSRFLENYIPPYNATAVDRLINAGVVTLGKTNTDEFAMGSSTENSAYGASHNPWNIERVPGGSSGGSAAAVAAGMAIAALGTDTGGSVRQPASYCGITGFKPSYGRVSRYGLVAYGSSLDVVGILARTAEDAAILFKVIGGWDARDATTLEKPLPNLSLNSDVQLKGLKIGIPAEYFVEGMQKDVEEKVRQAISEMEKWGAEVLPVQLPHTIHAVPVYYLLASAEASANLARYDGVRFGLRKSGDTAAEMFKLSRGAGFGPEVKRRIMLGTYALSAGYYDAYYGQAQKVRTLIKRDFDAAFEKVDVIATPVTPTTAFPLGKHNEDPLSMYLEDVFTLPANLAGIPGISFPVGFDREGMPVGMQLMGPHFREDILLRTAHSYQQVTSWHKQKPEMKFPR